MKRIVKQAVCLLFALIVIGVLCPTTAEAHVIQTGATYDYSHSADSEALSPWNSTAAKENDIPFVLDWMGEDLTWELSKDGTLTVSANGPMGDFSYPNEAPWEDQKDKIKKVVISEGVTQIANEAFCDCENLSSVTLPEGLTSLGDSAFERCGKLKSIQLPDTVTEIGYDVFAESGLTSITIPKSMTVIGTQAFNRCDQLTSVVIPDGVTEIDYFAFCDCTSLREITIPGSVKTICGDAFNSCESLKKVTIENGLTTIGKRAFWYCENLKKVTLPNSLISIGEDAFFTCGLTSLTIPDSVTTIEDGAFSGCGDLTGVHIPASVTEMGAGVFKGSWLQEITVDPENPNFTTDGENKLLLTKDKKTIVGSTHIFGDYEIPDYVTAIDDSAFGGCYNMWSIVIPDGVTTIGANAFSGCFMLSTITIPDSVTSIGAGAFFQSGLMNIVLPKGLACLEENLFLYCDNLRSVVIPDGVTSVESRAFEDCVRLKVVYIPASVTGIAADAFNKCEDVQICGVAGSYAETFANEHNIPFAEGKPLTLDSISATTSAANGQKASITINAVGDGLKYKWYYAAPGDDMFEEVTSVKGNTYSVTMDEEVDGAQVICVISDLYGFTQETEAITLHMKTTVRLIKQPTDVTVASGKEAAVTVQAIGDGLTYEWYYKNPGAAEFTKSTSFTGKSYSVTMNRDCSGTQVYCVITDQYGNSVRTNVAAMYMDASVKVVAQPMDVVAAYGEKATVTVEAIGEGLSYEWYYRNPGASKFSKTAGFTGNSCSVTMNSNRNGRQVYCVITDQYGTSVQTDMATMYMDPTVKVLTHPMDVTVASGEKATVTVEAVGEGLTYEWYYRNPGASKFSKTAGFTGNSCSVTMNSSRNGRQVYCVITDRFGNSVQTLVAMMYMKTGIEVITQPTDVVAASGEKAVVTVEAVGEGLTYEWYYKNPGASKFSKTAGFTGNSCSVTMNKSRDGRQVYCVITDQYGNSVKTDVATMSVGNAVKLISVTSNTTAPSGKTAKITIKATGEGLSYQWYFKNSTSKKFSSSSITGKTYSITMSRKMDGRQVYCVITDQYGNRVRTETITMHMGNPVKITNQPVNVSAASGKKATVTVKATGDGLKYEWYYKSAGASKFTLSASSTGNSYSLSMSAARSGRQVYCVITDQYGNQVTTNTVTMRLKK